MLFGDARFRFCALERDEQGDHRADRLHQPLDFRICLRGHQVEASSGRLVEKAEEVALDEEQSVVVGASDKAGLKKGARHYYLPKRYL